MLSLLRGARLSVSIIHVNLLRNFDERLFTQILFFILVIGKRNYVILDVENFAFGLRDYS
jgi:hypothetical protein